MLRSRNQGGSTRARQGAARPVRCPLQHRGSCARRRGLLPVCHSASAGHLRVPGRGIATSRTLEEALERGARLLRLVLPELRVTVARPRNRAPRARFRCCRATSFAHAPCIGACMRKARAFEPSRTRCAAISPSPDWRRPSSRSHKLPPTWATPNRLLSFANFSIGRGFPRPITENA